MDQDVRGTLDGQGRRFAVVWSRFNHEVTELLRNAAVATLHQHGVAARDVEVFSVPGAFELPLTSAWLARTGRFHGVIALGAVIRGETNHYDYVCAEAARGTLDAGMDSDVPVAFGVLTCDTDAQAMDRAGGRHGNKGADAAEVALEMASLRETLLRRPP